MLKEIIDTTTLMHELHGLNPFDKNYYFYFDETNNIRKFILKPSNELKVNKKEALQADFILGGVCFENAPDCDELFNFFENQGIVEELKSKYLFRHNNFQYDFKGDRVTTLLKWFEENQNVYLHYAIENNLYFGLVDIVDSLLNDYPQMIEMHFHLKDALFRICKLYQDDVLNLLGQYEYPNVSKDNMREFTRKLSYFIDDADMRNDFYVECLRQMLKAVNKTTEMTFITDNEPYLLQDDYSAIYLQRMVTFMESELFFDEEKEVIKRLDKTGYLNQFPRCSFVCSTTERFVQISDCIIACLSKTFQFLDNLDIVDIADMKVEEMLNDNLRRLQSLVYRSNNKNRLLILNLNAQSLTQERIKKLAILCAK